MGGKNQVIELVVGLSEAPAIVVGQDTNSSGFSASGTVGGPPRPPQVSPALRREAIEAF